MKNIAIYSYIARYIVALVSVNVAFSFSECLCSPRMRDYVWEKLNMGLC